MTAAEFASALAPFSRVSPQTLARCERYLALLEKWNRAINLVGKTSLKDPWRRHFLDSAQLWPLIQGIRDRGSANEQPLRLLDLGSGAGFPGLVLALLAREDPVPSDVILVEADQRKAQFLAHTIRILGAMADPAPPAPPLVQAAAPTPTKAPRPLARVLARRIETLEPFPVDVVTARALAPLPELMNLSAPFLRAEESARGGATALFLKGRGLEEELTALGPSWHTQATTRPSLTDSAAGILEIRLAAEKR